MKYFHPVNRHKPYVDWREPEHRKEFFFRWFQWRLDAELIDHFLYTRAYTTSAAGPTGAPMNRAQKLWFSLLFGMTYNSSLAWVYYNHYPDPTNIEWDDLDKWNRATLDRQPFQTDTRYNKGRIVAIWQSIAHWIHTEGGGDIERAFDKQITSDATASYHNVHRQLLRLRKYGRMTAWLAAQCLYETAGLPIAPDTMFTDDPGNQSVWNGTCYYWSLENMTVGSQPKYAGYKPTPKDRAKFRGLEQQLMEECRARVDHPDLSYFTLETHLCQFKKLLTGGDCPGSNYAEHCDRYRQLEKLWPNVDFTPFGEAIMQPPVPVAVRGIRASTALEDSFKITGQPINMHGEFEDLPNMYAELAISRHRAGDHDYEKTIRHRMLLYAKAQAGGWASQHELKLLYSKQAPTDYLAEKEST